MSLDDVDAADNPGDAESDLPPGLEPEPLEPETEGDPIRTNFVEVPKKSSVGFPR